MDTLKQTRATKIQRREDVEWGLRGLLRLYWVPACFACLLAPKVLALKSSWTSVHMFKVVQCTAMACNLVFTLRTKPGWCAFGSSPTSASTRVPIEYVQEWVPREGQGAGRDKIYGKPTEGGILAPPPPQFETRPHFFPSHLQHFHGSNYVLMHWHLQYLPCWSNK